MGMSYTYRAISKRRVAVPTACPSALGDAAGMDHSSVILSERDLPALEVMKGDLGGSYKVLVAAIKRHGLILLERS